MDDKEFNRLADEILARIEAALEASEADLDFELAAGGVLEIEFADGSKIIVNRHAAWPRKSGWRRGPAASIFAGMVPPGATPAITPNCWPKLSALASQQAGEIVDLT
jgi:CyaY protein